MDLLKISTLLSVGLISGGCQLGYLTKSAYNQISLLNSRVDMEEALKDPALTEAERAKIHLSQKVRAFATSELHLKESKNYSRFVKLDRPYVSYVINAAPKWELKHFEWSYPFVGKMPYRGYFNEADAKEEEVELQKQGLDTYLRGVSAFSTLGWFEDPLLSSMLKYSDHDLVDTLIHETVHATLYIKNSADFNERMAVFVGGIGTEAFYLKQEGPDSPTLKQIKLENEDEKIFSKFIGEEIKALETWYTNLGEKNEALRQERLEQITTKFKTEIAPLLKSQRYSKFAATPLNNARILIYKTYVQDLNNFAKLFNLVGHDIEKFLAQCKKLESHPKPEVGLQELIENLK